MRTMKEEILVSNMQYVTNVILIDLVINNTPFFPVSQSAINKYNTKTRLKSILCSSTMRHQHGSVLIIFSDDNASNHHIINIVYINSLVSHFNILINSMAYGSQSFNVALTRALRLSLF